MVYPRSDSGYRVFVADPRRTSDPDDERSDAMKQADTANGEGDPERNDDQRRPSREQGREHEEDQE